MSEKKVIKTEILDNPKVVMQTLYDKSYEYEFQKIILPKITKEELISRYKRIKPIVNIDDIYYLLKEFTVEELTNLAYTWRQEKDKREMVDASSIETIGEFPCYHTYGFYGFFKPSIEEVLSQFPDDMLKQANAFYLYHRPETTYDLTKNSDIINAGCHKSTVKALVLKK